MKSSTDRIQRLYPAALVLLGASLLPACSQVQVVPGARPGDQERQARAVPVSAAVERRFREALAFIAVEEYSRAEALLRDIIAASPGLAGPHLNLGMVYAATGRDEQARQAYARAIALRPGHAAAYNELGILYRRMGEFAKARDAYQQALRIAPDYALAHRNLGILFDLYLREPGRALSHYRRYQALLQQPDREVTLWITELDKRLARARKIARSAP